MSEMYIDVDTAVTVIVNKVPLTDDTDFKSREVAITYNQAGMDLVWNFTTSAGVVTQTAVTPTTAGVYDWTHVGDGVYKIEIPASGGASINNDTEGYGYFSGICTGVLSWVSPIYTFRAAALNDAMVDGGDNLDVNTVQVSGTAQTANDNGADINAILVDTAEIGAAGAGLTALATAANLATVDTVVDGIQTDLSNATDGLGAIKTAVDSRMAEASINTTAGAIDNVTLVATTTTNTDMRGTDNAATAASLATAQTDLDTITGADGAALASTQQSITFQPITITAGDAIANITLAGSGSEDGIKFSRSGSGDPFDANIMAQINAEIDTALTDYDAATGTELAATEAKIDIIDTNVDAVLVDTGTTIPAQITALNDISVADVLTTQMTEAYAADGTAPTLAEALFLINSVLNEFAIVGTTITSYKLDGTTVASTHTLDSATVPTSRTRSS